MSDTTSKRETRQGLPDDVREYSGRPRRMFVLALDGATFDVVEPWLRSGALPNLQKLVQTGVSGHLQSVYPPLTGPAWGSFATGKHPANHSVLEFLRREPGGYKQSLNTRRDLDGRTIWRVLGDAGKKVIVLSIPLSYPAEAVNGYLVTGILTPQTGNVQFTYPPELGAELIGTLGRYVLQHARQGDPERLLQEVYANLDNRIDAGLYMMRTKPWDFFAIHVMDTDVVQHEFWHYMDPHHPHYDPALVERHGNVVYDFWRRVDLRIGEMLDQLPPDTHVVVMSDHGFGPVIKYINFNVWLLKSRFLHLKRGTWSRLRHFAFRLGFNYVNAYKVGARAGILRRIVKLGYGKQESLQRKVFLSLDDVDWSRTQVYSMGNFGQMFVNLRGREPEGCVSPGSEYEAVLQRLEQELRAMRDPETGEPVIGEIWRGTELFQGKYLDRAPDLFFFTTDMKYKAMGLTDFGSNHVFDPLYGTRAHHRMNGLLIVRGPGVREGERIEGARLVDLAPTIYALMGVPIPLDLDGRVLDQVLGPAREVLGSGVSIAPVYEDGQADGFEVNSEQVYTAEEEALVMEQLRSLGYVE